MVVDNLSGEYIVVDDKVCFFVTPIGSDNSDIRRRANLVFKHVVNPAVSECGFACVRADQIAEPGIITNQIIDHLIEDHLVVADLTGHNPNVFYELAIRHARGKPIIHIIDINDPIPFDVAAMRTIKFDYRDLDSAERARDAIKEYVEAAGDRLIDTPLSVAVDLRSMRMSDDPEKREVGRILELLTQIQRSQEEGIGLLKNIRTEFGSPVASLRTGNDLGRTRYVLSIEDLQELSTGFLGENRNSKGTTVE